MALRTYWSPQEDAQILKLAQAGLTHGQIEHRMVDRSRSSISGKIKRMKRDGLL